MQYSNFVLPDFHNSIVNIGATMAQFLGTKPHHDILPKLYQKLDPKTKNIVYLVIDGMGDRILAKNLPADSFLRRHQIQTVTSVFPSTTTSATTSLLSGLTAAEHGWFAWALDFDGTVVELFRNRNFYTKTFLTDPQFIQKRLPYANLWDAKTTSHRIYTLFPKISYKNSAEFQTEYQTLREMFRKIKKICYQPEQKFLYVYYPDFDSTMHQYGTTARQTKKLLRTLERKIAHCVKHTPNTTFVITADHGQTDIKDYTYIYQDTEIQNCLAHPIAWDSRATSFKVKPDCHEKFKQAFQKYQKDYDLYTADELIQQGLLGDFAKRPDLIPYLGDYIAIGKDTGKLMVLQPTQKSLNRGSHSGLTADEMLVPVIVAQGGKKGN